MEETHTRMDIAVLIQAMGIPIRIMVEVLEAGIPDLITEQTTRGIHRLKNQIQLPICRMPMPELPVEEWVHHPIPESLVTHIK
jgi:hypothetical protein